MSTGISNGILYVGNQSPSDFINNQSINMAVTQTIESGVLAGPVTVPATITITGTLVVV
jgi:hypothetical protein|tara:strand:- start:4 stop:180 length:177 start_codon:yes stop_codon:yes gene_type:complete